MTYLNEFRTQISNRDFSKFLQLWEEYCTSDHVDTEEFLELLKSIKASDFARSFGKLIETAIPLWQTIKDKGESYKVLKALIDLQITNSPVLADLALEAIKERYSQDPQFNERLRLIGLRTKENFQGALSNYDLLAHMDKGKFVFHTGGWGTGEIVEISPIRQQVAVEFENVSGRKHLTFENAFKTLIPLENEHFLVRRFADPDKFEKDARNDALAIVKMLLKDLGPKTAGEIKDELCELVIPEDDWTKWWQGARSKLKKDPLIEPPESLKEPFRLRKTELSHEDRLHQSIHEKSSVDEIILTAYNFVRDLPGLRQKAEVKNSMLEKLNAQLRLPDISPEQELQICILLEGQFGQKLEDRCSETLIQRSQNIEGMINAIDIIALKKRAMVLVREQRKDWEKLFLQMLRTAKQSNLRDYILKELSENGTKGALENELRSLMRHPESAPDLVVWYFQKLIGGEDEHLPLSDKEGQCLFFEAFLILYSYLENKAEYRELLKKMYNILSGKRYAAVRAIMADASVTYIKELLLLASKCQSLGDKDMKILRSLAEVANPELHKEKKKTDQHIIWTTEESYLKIQEQVKRLGTVEIVEVAREIEAARALGDLRENSEYKFALEKRSRLQGQLKTLSDQLHHARILTKNDVSADEVSVGSVIELKDGKGNSVKYTILGPWDANPEDNVLSFQSKLAQAMVGCKPGDTFQFREDEWQVSSIKSYFD